MLFVHYLKEVKYRFFYCIISFFSNFLILFIFAKELLFIIVDPLLKINKKNDFYYFIFTDMADVLLIYIKIAFVLSVISLIPLLLFQVWFFLVQGLYNYEKNFLLFLLLFSLIFFIVIFLFLYIYLIPFIWSFFINFELTMNNSLFGIYYEAKINDYVNFMFYIFGIFCSFLLIPIIMICLLYFKILNIQFFVSYRKYFIITIFILGGVLSPPDIFSQIFISSIILFIYEIILFYYLLLHYYQKNFNG